MGVETSAYAIPPKMMRKIRAENENLDYVFGNSDEEKPEWKFDEMDFGKRFAENIIILREAGYRKLCVKLDLEDYFYSGNERNFLEYDGYEIVILTPSVVKAVAREFETVKIAELKADSLAKEIKDYYGHTIHENEYDYYISNIRQMKKYFQKNAAAGNFIIFATA